MTNEMTWEFDRKVPLAIIGTLIFQFVLGIWYAAKFDSRVNLLEQQIVIIQQNYATLNLAREAAALKQQELNDKSDRQIDLMRALINRSDILHPEFKTDPRFKKDGQ